MRTVLLHPLILSVLESCHINTACCHQMHVVLNCREFFHLLRMRVSAIGTFPCICECSVYAVWCYVPGKSEDLPEAQNRAAVKDQLCMGACL